MPVTPTELNQKLLEDLLAIQIKAETAMLEKVAKRVKKGVTTPGWNEKKLEDTQLLRQEILAILNDKDKMSKSLIQKSILKAYETAGNKVSNVILNKPITLMNDLIPLHLQHMILETNKAIAGTSFQILRNVDDVYRDIISETTTGVLTGTEIRQQVAQQALNNFAAKGVTGFIDKLGRKWELASYTEMAIRTANARAALQGHVDRSLELGQDLMLVSGHSATCPICAPWGNKVISITGKTPGYPTLSTAKEAGLFHPNCKHTLTVWFPDLEGNQEHLEEYQQEPDIEKYNAIQKQRYNERKIREWKRIEAVALDPIVKQKANNKVLEWQAIQRDHVKQYNLRRKYIREGIKNRTGDPTKASSKPDISKVYKPIDKIESTPEVKLEPQKEIKKAVETKVEIDTNQKLKFETFSTPKDYTLQELQNLSVFDKQKILLSNTKIKYSEMTDNEENPSWYKVQIEKMYNEKAGIKETKAKEKAEVEAKPKPVKTEEQNRRDRRMRTKEEIDATLDEQTNNYYDKEDQWIKQANKWIEDTPKTQIAAVKQYTGSSYDAMNRHIRGIKEGDDNTIRKINNCTKALSKIKVEEEMVVRRGVSYSGFAGMFDERDLAKTIGGETWMEGNMDKLVGRMAHDKGFLSTSPHKYGGFRGNVNIKIDLPVGTEGAYVDAISSHKGEKEFLIQKGYNYIITKVEKHEIRGKMSEQYTVYMSALVNN